MNSPFLDKLFQSHSQKFVLPSPELIQGFIDHLLGILFPAFSINTFKDKEELNLEILKSEGQLLSVLLYVEQSLTKDIDGLIAAFYAHLPKIYDLLIKDSEALEAGDPAAKNKEEVIRSYPGFYAIAVYRIANSLHNMEVPFIPRMLTEYAHSKTGIDIHPAAKIGESFFIDHGTGVVIGETSFIGNNVKLYQGVTLGALSVNKTMANTKRHPNIEDGVVIYAGATILGGETVIGGNSVIGGNVWITSSVPPNSVVHHQSQTVVEKAK